jgi:NADH dehydrogenase FAD-containing subunit
VTLATIDRLPAPPTDTVPGWLAARRADAVKRFGELGFPTTRQEAWRFTDVSPIAGAAGLDVDDRGRIVTDESLRSVSHPNVYAVGDAAAIQQGYGVMHGTCQSGIPTALHAAASIVRELKGKQPKKFRFGYVHQPVSLGRHDGVIQFTHADDSPGRFYLAGRFAVAYKETVSSSPWTTYRLLKVLPALGAATWRRGVRSTRDTSRSPRPR